MNVITTPDVLTHLESTTAHVTLDMREMALMEAVLVS